MFYYTLHYATVSLDTCSVITPREGVGLLPWAEGEKTGEVRQRGPARRVQELPAASTRAAMRAAAPWARGGWSVVDAAAHGRGANLCGVKARGVRARLNSPAERGAGREGRRLATWVKLRSHSSTLVPIAALLMCTEWFVEERKPNHKPTQRAELQPAMILKVSRSAKFLLWVFLDTKVSLYTVGELRRHDIVFLCHLLSAQLYRNKTPAVPKKKSLPALRVHFSYAGNLQTLHYTT